MSVADATVDTLRWVLEEHAYRDAWGRGKHEKGGIVGHVVADHPLTHAVADGIVKTR